MENVLSKVNIALSPAVAQLVPVTLPYGYKQVEESTPVDTSSLPLIIRDSESYIAGLTAKHESRIAAIEKWKQDKKQRDIEEKRKLAPGYFDDSNHLLVPTRKQSAPTAEPSEDVSLEKLSLS